MTVTRLARRKGFQCMHRYAVEEWSAERNRETFGACFTATGHGHNYELEAYFEGPVDPHTGMVLNLTDVDQLLDEVLAPIAGQHVNFTQAEFKSTVPTTENLASYLLARLTRTLKAPQVRVVKIRLYENEDLWVDVWP